MPASFSEKQTDVEVAQTYAAVLRFDWSIMRSPWPFKYRQKISKSILEEASP